MGNNTFGDHLKITSFGESHGSVIGVIIDGMPAGLDFDLDYIQRNLAMRRPNQSKLDSIRKEPDKAEILSGIFKQKTTGAPICIIIQNKDINSTQYHELKDLLRPSHIDYSALKKYGGYSDYRGSGRFSGRITASFVIAGAMAKQLLSKYGIEILAYTKSIGSVIDDTKYKFTDISELLSVRENSPVRALNVEKSKKMMKLIENVKKEGDSIGGLIRCIVVNFPAGIGGPIFNGMESSLSQAIFSIPAMKGIEFGAGFKAAQMKGSEHNDPWIIKEGKIVTEKNDSGGIIGGISTGMPIEFNVAVKPTSSISLPQRTVNIKTKKEGVIRIRGRHDPCIVPRAVVVIEAMTAVVLVDYLLKEGNIPSVLKSK